MTKTTEIATTTTTIKKDTEGKKMNLKNNNSEKRYLKENKQ